MDDETTLRDLRSLLEGPFRNYANFSGGAGRAEFWLFLLSLFVATNIAWIIGYGGMMLAGYQSHDHRYETYHQSHAPDDDPGTNGPSLSQMGHEGHDRLVIFKFHRHSSEEGYLLYGSVDAEHFLDEHYRRDDAKGRAGKRGSEDMPGMSSPSNSQPVFRQRQCPAVVMMVCSRVFEQADPYAGWVRP